MAGIANDPTSTSAVTIMNGNSSHIASSGTSSARSADRPIESSRLPAERNRS